VIPSLVALAMGEASQQNSLSNIGHAARFFPFLEEMKK
jgi:hypothetical protein